MDNIGVKRLFSLMLLAAALFGLIGQEAGFARPLPVAPVTQAIDAAMSAECAEMMGLTKQKPQPDKPCEGMTPDCVAQMGCAVPAVLAPPLAVDSFFGIRGAAPRQAPVAPLFGLTTGPEPHPPARLD